MLDLSRENVKAKMDMFRLGYGMPEEYIVLHENAARANLDAISGKGYEIVGTNMVRDGWMDGMKVLEVETVNINGDTTTFRWSDSNGGSWFQECESGGQALFASVENKPGFL